MNADSVLVLDAQIVVIVTALVIPFAVSLITKIHAPSWLKAVLAAVLSIVSGVIAVGTQMDGTALISKATVVAAVIAWITQGTAYARLLKPAGVTDAIENRTAGFGLG